MGESFFVPEGRPDSSQARSPWGRDAEKPRPGGTVEGTVNSRDNLSSKRTIQSSRWDGALFLIIQALRAWLLSGCPSGTKYTRMPSGRSILQLLTPAPSVHQAETPQVHRIFPVGGIGGAVDRGDAGQRGMASEWLTIQKLRRVKNRGFRRGKTFWSSSRHQTHPVILEPGGATFPGA
jgi:hypothetical protein